MLLIILSAFKPATSHLEEFYGASVVQTMQQQSPSTYDYLLHLAENGVEIMYNVPPKKLNGLPDISEIPLLKNHAPYDENNFTDFNVLFVDLPKRERGAYLYRIGSTDHVLVIQDQFTLRTLFNNARLK